MKVLILGSNRHLDDPQKIQFAEACEALGAALANNGASLILCSQSTHTADPCVLKGAKRKNKKKNGVVLYQPSRKEKVEQGAPAPDSPDLKLWEDIPLKIVDGEWRVVHLKAINDADVIVALGGSSGSTQTAIFSAELLSKIPVLIPTFGGTAQDNWGYFRGRYYSDLEAESLLKPWGSCADTTAGEITKVIRSISKRSRPTAKAWEVIGLVVLGLLSVGSWMYIMFSSASIISAPATLCLLLAAASISGSVLRLLSRKMANPLPIERNEGNAEDEDNAIVSITLGILLGFGLLIAGGFTNLTLNAKFLTVETYEDAKRIGLSFSTIIFVAAILLEQAWARLVRQGIRRLSS